MDKKELLDNLLFYLKRNGWVQKESRYRGMFLFADNQTYAELLFPKNPDSGDFESYINNSIDVISAVEDVSGDVIKISVNNIGKDLHNIRVPGCLDSVPLRFVEQVMSSIKRLFELSAKSEIRKDPEIRENKNIKFYSALDDYMSACAFAHTWRGSFGLTIEAPLQLKSIGLFLDNPENRERRISKKIFNGIRILDTAVELGSVDYIVDSAEKGFDGRMCLQFCEIADQLKYPSLEYSAQWSPVIPVDERIEPKKKIILTNKTFSFAEKAASKMLVSEDEKIVWFTGYPEVLRSQKEDILDENTFGEYAVSVKGSSQETGYAVLKMDLDLNDYRKALLAHENAKDIRVKCLLKRKIKGWEVLKIYEFKLME